MKRELILSKLEKIFNEKGIDYKYELKEDVPTRMNITVTCPIHGKFNKRLSRLLDGKGCPKCSGKVKKTFDEFVNEANIVHNGEYSYEDDNYVNSHTKIGITCPKHGIFYQTPTNHLNGNGCPKCKGERLSRIFSSNNDTFIKSAISVHGDKYDYSKVEYINNYSPVCIVCKKHGDFYQIPHNHLQGKGCPKCNESKMEKEVAEVLDENNIEYIHQWHLPWNKYYSLDFFIPDINIGIECQGIQHFEEGHFKNTTLKDTQERDEYKLETCKENGIDILYYSNTSENECITNKEDIITIIKLIKDVK